MADVLRRRGDTDGEFPTLPGSSMAGDDARLGGHQLTTAFRFCLMAAIDHLHAVTALVERHRMLHVAAPGSLARGILENAAAGFWLIHPVGRNERITRTLRWFATNALDQDTAVEGLPDVGGSRAEEVLSRLRELAEVRGIDPRAAIRRYTSTEVVTYAETHARFAAPGRREPPHVLLAWRTCSGFAHGRPWAHLAASEKAFPPTGLSESGLNSVRLTNSMALALWPTLIGFNLLEAVLRVHQARALPP